MSLKLPARKWVPENESMALKEKEYSSISNLGVLVCDFGIRHLALPQRYLLLHDIEIHFLSAFPSA